MSEAKSGCRAKTVGTSLVEYTFTLTVIARPNTSQLDECDPNLHSWAQQHGYINHLMIERIVDFIERSRFDHIDGNVLAEDITAASRELRLHADTERCEHGD